MHREIVDLPLSHLRVQSNGYHAKDEEGNVYFVSGREEYRKQQRFNSVSRCPISRFMLLGIGIANNYLVYEQGTPWMDNNLEYIRYHTRDFLCGLHHLHCDLQMCHSNIKLSSNSLVISRGMGKLAGMKGCNKCSIKGQTCGDDTVEDDVVDLVTYINTHMNVYVDQEFTSFLHDMDNLMKLITYPVHVIYQHPIWINHPANKLASRAILNRRFQLISDSDIRKKARAYCRGLSPDWRTFIGGKSQLSTIFNFPGTSYPMTDTINYAKEVKNMARFGRNVHEHGWEFCFNLVGLEIQLEEMAPSFRSFMFNILIEFDRLGEWNLERIR